MEMIGYGEDALTLWTFRHRLDAVLSQLGNGSSEAECTLFFRPSFGRKGGADSAQFGEFDFILLTPICLYLGEAKWDRSPEASTGTAIHLRPEQVLRHTVFRQYVKEWTCGCYESWRDFLATAEPGWTGEKSIAPVGSLLAENLQKVLRTIRGKYKSTPEKVDVLLYLHDRDANSGQPTAVSTGFNLVVIDYSTAKFGNFIRM
jgi:hypothetical protein